MTIKTRLRIIGLLPVGLALIIGLILLFSSQQMYQMRERARFADEIAQGMFELNIVTHDYLLHREERQRVQWRSKYDSLAHLLKRLEFDRSAEEVILAKLRQNHESIGKIFSQIITNYERQKSGEANIVLSRESEERSVGQFVAKSRAMVTDTFHLIDLNYTCNVTAQERNHLLAMVSVIILAAILAANAFFIRRDVLLPIAHLHRGTEVIGSGNLNHKIGLSAKDEIGALSRSFDQMVEKLETTTVSRNELVEEVAEHKRTQKTLDSYTKELERSNGELEQFAYVASHDLQEPLRMVASYTQLLERCYKEQPDESAGEFINYAVDGAKRMQKLIDDLLVYSRVGAKAKEFVETDCEIIFEQAVMNLQIAIQESGGEVSHDALPKVMADDVQLSQLFQNLIGNAIKFHGEAPPRVHVSAEQKENEWVFSVQNNGIGIAPEFSERIFQIFQRLHTRDEYSGTGIGLAVCKKIVERHGGHIWVESPLEQGAIFYFTLPIQEVMDEQSTTRKAS